MFPIQSVLNTKIGDMYILYTIYIEKIFPF